MAAYIRYYPGPTIDEYTSDIDDLFGALIQEMSLLSIDGASLGGGSPSRNWYLNTFANTTGAQPYWSVNYACTAADNTYEVRLRYNPTLTLSLDPSYVIGANALWPAGFMNFHTVSSLEAWKTRKTNVTNMNSAITGIGALLQPMFAGTTAFGWAAGFGTFTDGTNAGKLGWIAVTANYNPTTSEVSAGIFQLDFRRTGVVSDLSGNDMNVIDGNQTAASTENQVPVIVLQGDASATAWDDFLGVQPTSNRNTTNSGDLGGTDHPSKEPTSGGVDIYDGPGVIAQLLSSLGGGIIAALTTLPAAIMSFLVVASQVAWALSQLVLETEGVIALENLGAIAENTGSMASDLNAIRVYIDEHGFGGGSGDPPDLSPIVTALEASTTQLSAMTTDLEGINDQVEDVAIALRTTAGSISIADVILAKTLSVDVDLSAVEAHLVDLVEAADLGASDLTDLRDALRQMRDKMDELKEATQTAADNRNNLRVKVRGIEVQADSGAIYDPDTDPE